MSENHVKAGQKRWVKVSPEERSHQMSLLAKKRQSSMTQAQKVKHALMMVEARKKAKK